MPPVLALFVTVVFCVFVLRRIGRDQSTGGALWLPIVWIFFVGTRHPAQWLALFGLGNFMPISLEEGSPLDAGFYLVLIAAGMRVLACRQVSLSALVRENFWIFIFAGYCFLAILWSDFPLVSFKRWIKTLGHPVMALVILTHPNPMAAIRLVLMRCGAVMLTFSVLVIKYFPEYGRSYEPWSGQAMYSGINLNKNELGYCCLIFGLFFVWNLITSGNIENPQKRREERVLSATFLLMAMWLLNMAQSSTSLVTLGVGSAIVVGLGFRFVPKRNFGIFVVASIILAATTELTIGIYGPIVEMLGKDATLTDRTAVWADVIGMVNSPLFGTGFESFWLGPRLDALWAKWWWQPNQAHNGYIETYLNLGLIGLGLLGILLFSTFRKITATFSTELDFARFRMAFLFVIVLYNFTEATFKAVHLLWTVFYLIALRVPQIGDSKVFLSDTSSNGNQDFAQQAVGS
jgi:exopolysaccharide production protein ExoQ